MDKRARIRRARKAVAALYGKLTAKQRRAKARKAALARWAKVA